MTCAAGPHRATPCLPLVKQRRGGSNSPAAAPSTDPRTNR